MSTSHKPSPKKRRPLRKLLFLAVITGTVVAIKNALEDKGGSYEAPDASAPVPTPPTPAQTSTSAPSAASSEPTVTAPATGSPVVTAEDIVVQRPVENLDEFAEPATTPAQPGVDPVDEAIDKEQPIDNASPVVDAADREPTQEAPAPRKRSAASEAVGKADKTDPEAPGKIDPFGIR